MGAFGEELVVTRGEGEPGAGTAGWGHPGRLTLHGVQVLAEAPAGNCQEQRTGGMQHPPHAGLGQLGGIAAV